MPAPLYSWTPVVMLHAGLAATAVMLGGMLLRSRKGHLAHRIGGWLWVTCMALVAGVSFAIYGPRGYSWIHGLSVFTLVSLVIGVYLARTHRVRAHRAHMITLYIGALVITGLFTLLPGRLLGSALWGWLGVS